MTLRRFLHPTMILAALFVAVTPFAGASVTMLPGASNATYLRGTFVASLNRNTLVVRAGTKLVHVHLRGDTQFRLGKTVLRDGTPIVVLGDLASDGFVAAEIDDANALPQMPALTASSPVKSTSPKLAPNPYEPIACGSPQPGKLQYIDCSNSPYGPNPAVVPIYIVRPSPQPTK